MESSCAILLMALITVRTRFFPLSLIIMRLTFKLKNQGLLQDQCRSAARHCILLNQTGSTLPQSNFETVDGSFSISSSSSSFYPQPPKSCQNYHCFALVSICHRSPQLQFELLLLFSFSLGLVDERLNEGEVWLLPTKRR